MPATTNYGFPYPGFGDAPSGPGALQALAEAIDAQLHAIATDVETRLAALEVIFQYGAVAQDFESALANFSSTSYTETFTTSNTPAATTFEAPSTGKVKVHMRSWMDNNLTAGRTYLSFVVREGGVIGSGTTFLGASDQRAIHNMSAEDNEFGATFRVSGLTPGGIYNIRNAGRVTAGIGESQNRELIVDPVWQ